MRASIVLVAAIATVLILAPVVAADLTAADFKKMTMKQLKQWLQQRDIAFHDISEKSEFVQRALEWVANNKRVVREEPKVPFWEMWANIAKEKCVAAVTQKSLGDEGAKVCDAISVATDSFFMMHGKRTAQKLKKSPAALAKTSNGDIYFNAGSRIFNRLIGHCLNAKNRAACGSSSHITQLLEKDTVKGTGFAAFITNVGIENTNPMYEVVNSKSHSDEL